MIDVLGRVRPPMFDFVFESVGFFGTWSFSYFIFFSLAWLGAWAVLLLSPSTLLICFLFVRERLRMHRYLFCFVWNFSGPLGASASLVLYPRESDGIFCLDLRRWRRLMMEFSGSDSRLSFLRFVHFLSPVHTTRSAILGGW
jgi:hypothetical protein